MGRRHSRYDNFPRFTQPSAAELEKKAEAYQAQNTSLAHPVRPKTARGNPAQSWWGQAWCDNLERYADYTNRISRGRRYVRSGAVVDLQIHPGLVTARVAGSSYRPYEVTIRVDPLPPERISQLNAQCGSRAENLEALLGGSFPADLKEIFFAKGGLFPSPKELHFDCSCPDWAHMCKHVAAALYGVGVRFDDDPLLFFQLRGLDPEKFLDTAVRNRIESMLENADRPSRRILSNEAAEELFGL